MSEVHHFRSFGDGSVSARSQDDHDLFRRTESLDRHIPRGVSYLVSVSLCLACVAASRS